MRTAACLTVLLGVSAVIAAQADERADTTAIVASCDGVDAALIHHAGELYYGNVDDPRSWHNVGDAGEDEYSKATVYRLDRRIRKVVFTLTTASDDWVLYATYCFRDDGTVARIHERLNTFYGHLSRVRTTIYAAKGNVLRNDVAYLDLATKEPRRAPPEDFISHDAPRYKTAAALPFGTLRGR